MESFRVYLVLGLLSLSLRHVADGAVDMGTIFFRCYKGASFNDVNINKMADLFSQLNLNEETMFHIHGFTENVEHESVKKVIQAYLDYTTSNIIAIDYRDIADDMNYIADVEHVSDVARAIANSLNILVAKGLNPNIIHIVGHSLGGQVAASIGLYTSFNISKIIGLDPAGPMYYSGRYLKRGDAKFVVIIHTDAGIFGQPYHSGDVDFLPNYGHAPQPGCTVFDFLNTPEINCNHRRSWRFFAESVGNRRGFMAIQCDNDKQFYNKQCNQSNIVPMGYDTPSTTRGLYYLKTNSQSPFALGLKGIE